MFDYNVHIICVIRFCHIYVSNSKWRYIQSGPINIRKKNNIMLDMRITHVQAKQD